MKLATYRVDGEDRYGIVVAGPDGDEPWVFNPERTQTHLEIFASDGTSPFLRSQVEFAGDQGWPDDIIGLLSMENGLERLRKLERFVEVFRERNDRVVLDNAGHPVGDVSLRAPIPRPRLLFGLVQNSPSSWRNDDERRHVNLFPRGHQRTHGSVVGPNDPVVLPPKEDLADSGDGVIGAWNPELAVVVGTGGHEIAVEDAMDHVAGYTIVTDMAFDRFLGDVREATDDEERDFFEAAMGSWGDKKSDSELAMGPYIVTPDVVGSPYDLLVYSRQSGRRRGRTHTDAMNLGVERTVSWLSTFRELHPGDVIHMATMGVDGSSVMRTDEFGPDDYFEGEIEGIGTLRNPVVFGGDDDWRPPDHPSRQHPSRTVRDAMDDPEQEWSAEKWTPADAAHFWLVFGNYETSTDRQNLPPRPYPRFLNTPTSALATDGSTVRVPSRSTRLSLGCELACVVNRVTRDVSPDAATDAIGGFAPMAVLRDTSFQDWPVDPPAGRQARDLPKVYARWPDGFNVLGDVDPAVGDGDIGGRDCVAAFDGAGTVTGSTAEYRRSAADIIAYISQGITLLPGDVVTCGRLDALLEMDERLPADASGHAEIEGIGRVTFRVDDDRD